MQGLVVVLARQYDIVIKDGLRCLDDEKTVKKIRRRESNFTLSNIKATASSLVFSGDLRGTVMALDFANSEERARSRYLARPEEIMLTEYPSISSSSHAHNSFGLDTEFSRHMLEIEADPNFSPALALTFHDLVNTSPRISYLSHEPDVPAKKQRKRKVFDERTEIRLDTLRTWTFNTADIVRRLPCNRIPRRDLSIVEADDSIVGPLRLKWEELWRTEEILEEAKRGTDLMVVEQEELPNINFPEYLPLANDPWLDDPRLPQEFPEVLPNLPSETPIPLYSPLKLDQQIVSDFFATDELTFDFLQRTASLSRAETACLFQKLMLKAHLEEVTIEQPIPFGPIQVYVRV
mmetsp:Transcript_19075/g.34661  ORF Transcript_19075/g.34661 Transcript_19075/m.34661 type:complete len:349 (-) Transcript_19075:319-1365(-)